MNESIRMRSFEYLVVDERGRDLQGQIEASDIKSAAGVLKHRGLFVASLSPLEEAPRRESQDHGKMPQPAAPEVRPRILSALARLQPIRMSDRVFFFQRTALMLRSGLTLRQALDESIRHTSNHGWRDALVRMQRAIYAGKRFSQAMAQEKQLFSPFMVKLVEIAENSGEMDTILDRLAHDLNEQAQVRASFATSLIYPAIVVMVGIVTLVFLTVKVIPRFAKLFASRQAALPWNTQILLDLSGWMSHYGAGAVILIGLLALVGFLAYMTSGGRLVIDRGLLSLPVIGSGLKLAAMAHLGRSLSILLQSGVTLLESLRIVTGLINNSAINRVLNRATRAMLEGKSCGEALRSPLIPTLVTQIIGVGERTGALDHALDEIGRFYHQQLQVMIKRMSTLIEPVLILMIGAMVGFVYYSFFQTMIGLVMSGR